MQLVTYRYVFDSDKDKLMLHIIEFVDDVRTPPGVPYIRSMNLDIPNNVTEPILFPDSLNLEVLFQMEDDLPHKTLYQIYADQPFNFEEIGINIK